MDVFLVRHGQSQYNARLTNELDSDLTLEGENQARLAGQALWKLNLHYQTGLLYSSPYRRTISTARIIQEECKLAHTIYDSRLGEVRTEPCFSYDTHLSLGYGITYNGLETEREVLYRLWQFVVYNILNVKNIYDYLIIVSHGSPIEVMLAMIKEGKTIDKIPTWCYNTGPQNGQIIKIAL